MADLTIYHNPKCSKSRQTLELLRSKGVEPTVIEYLKEPLNEAQVLKLLDQLESEPKTLVRTKEDIFKENLPSIESKIEIAKAIAKFPKLMERPLVVSDDLAILGRPPENVLKLL